jgi:hypothetical protein
MGFGQYSTQTRPADESRPAQKQAKRLKHVFDNPAHVWAHPRTKDGQGFEQTDARCASGNWYFKTSPDGTRVIYSYRDSYVIGSRFELGQKIIFLLRSGEPYSVTTSGHMNATWHAVPKNENNVAVFTVPEMVEGWTHKKPGKQEHAKNLTAYVAEITDAIERHSKARSSYNIRGTLNDAVSLTAEIKRYAKTFKLKLPSLLKLPKLDAIKLAEIIKREQAREAKQGAKRKAEREAYEAKEREKIPAWKRGENVYLRIYDGNALLRVKNGNVETSQGVNVPISGRLGAARLFRFLLNLKTQGKTFETNGHKEHIGNFSVTNFDGQLLIAGCHKITWEEITSISDAVLAVEEAETIKAHFDGIAYA